MIAEIVKNAAASIAVNMTAQLVKSNSLKMSMPYPIAMIELTTAATINDIVVTQTPEIMARRF